MEVSSGDGLIRYPVSLNSACCIFLQIVNGHDTKVRQLSTKGMFTRCLIFTMYLF